MNYTNKMFTPRKKDIDGGHAFKCEREGCKIRIWETDAYFHEYYSNKELTDFLEDIIYCKDCAKEFFNKEEFEYGAKKEYAFI